jgi:glycosyltransferase involved in cell wall biosynthesis
MKTGSQPLVSIVTPVYNGAEHLAECLDSILAQTYPAWDCTVVNNCSTDGSAEIARRYAARDPRIRLIENKQLLRAISNHNVALRQISPESKYCKVVFADDLIAPECLEKMVAVAEQHPSVGLVSAYCLEGQRVICAGLPYSTTFVSGLEICRKHLLDRLWVFGSANAVLYRADLVRSRDPFYNEANIHADTEVCFALLKTCDFGFVHQVLSVSRVRPGSLSTISADLNTSSGGTLHLLVTYGQDYLTEDELRTRIDQHLRGYYEYLSKNLVAGRDKKFWDYHKKQLMQASVGFSYGRMARATLANLWCGVRSPIVTVKKFLRARSKWRLTANG